MSDITKEELKAMIETQSKATEQMVMIANHLKDIVEEQKKISDKISNGMSDMIASKVGVGCAASAERFANVKKTMDEIRDNVFWCKVILGSATLIALVAQAIIHVTRTH